MYKQTDTHRPRAVNGWRASSADRKWASHSALGLVLLAVAHFTLGALQVAVEPVEDLHDIAPTLEVLPENRDWERLLVEPFVSSRGRLATSRRPLETFSTVATPHRQLPIATLQTRSAPDKTCHNPSTRYQEDFDPLLATPRPIGRRAERPRWIGLAVATARDE